MTGKRWTDERLTQLKALRDDGLSAGEIAAELGGVTRNAVIGKLHRLGLFDWHGPRVKAKPIPAPKPKPQRTVAFSPIPKPPTAPVIDSTPRGKSTVTLFELNSRNCHWPLDVDFCGADAVDGKPYCAHHHRIATRRAS